MEKIRFGIIGTGWRAEFFVRIAQEAHETFAVTSAYSRDAQRGQAFAERMGIAAVDSLEALAAQKPDFVVLCSARAANASYLDKLFDMGLPVLCETPPADDEETLHHLWAKAKATDAKVQVAEQYFLQPLYVALQKIIDKGLLGTVSNMNLSALHGYHGVSVLRRVLGAGMGEVTVSGKRYQFPLQATDSRNGIVKNGDVAPATRDRLTFAFENGTYGFFDFSGSQYHSFIRTRYLNIQGERGEIDNFDVRYVNEQGDAVRSMIVREDRGIYDNPALSHQHLSFNGEVLYQNPFLYKHFNDDEIAIAACMLGMAHYVKTGEEFYPFADALQDARVSIAMAQALESGEDVCVPKQPWA